MPQFVEVVACSRQWSAWSLAGQDQFELTLLSWTGELPLFYLLAELVCSQWVVMKQLGQFLSSAGTSICAIIWFSGIRMCIDGVLAFSWQREKAYNISVNSCISLFLDQNFSPKKKSIWNELVYIHSKATAKKSLLPNQKACPLSKPGCYIKKCGPHSALWLHAFLSATVQSLILKPCPRLSLNLCTVWKFLSTCMQNQ